MKLRFNQPEWRIVVTGSAVIALAFGLATHNLGAQSLDGDEAYSWETAIKPLAAVAQGLDPGNPPGHFIVLHLWIPLAGSSELGLRFLSVLFAVLSVSLLLTTVRALIGSKAAVVAGLLAAVNPFLLFFSQQTRAYSMLLALSLLALRILVALCGPKPDRRLWIVYALAVCASLYTHYYTLQLLPILAIAPLLIVRGRRWLSLVNLAALGAACAIFGAWFIPRLRVVENFLPVTAGSLSLGRLLTDYAIALHLGEAPYTVRRQLAHLPLPWALVSLGLVLAGAGVWRGAGIRARRQFLALSALLPLTTVTAFTFARHGDFDPRYAVVGAAGYLGLLAAGLCALRPRFLALTAGSCLVGSWLWAAHLYFTDPAYQRQDFRSAASALKADETPRDAVILVADYLTPLWRYYGQGGTSTQASEIDEASAGPRLAQKLETATSGARWIYVLNWFDPHAGIRGWLDDNKVLVNGQAFGEYVLYRYTAHSPLWTDRPPDMIPLDVRIGNDLSLVGYHESRLVNNGGVRLQVAWRRLAPAARDYWEVAWLVDGDGKVLDENGQWPGLGMFHFNTWDGQGVLTSERTLHGSPADSPLRIVVALFDPATDILEQPAELPFAPGD